MRVARQALWRSFSRTALAAAASLALLPGGVSFSAAQSKAPAKKSESSTAKSSTQAPAKSSGQKSTPRRASSRRRARAQQAPTPDRIKEIQAALAKAGHYNGEPTGKWDAKTIEALKAFQQANGVSPTGKLDARSLQKLGLGSDVGGAAPPRPPQDRPERNAPPKP
jgi:peptidoglycan hydrolase-like protein with peptidoglycan-binding domain